LYPIIPKNGEKCKFKVKLNDYWMNLHKFFIGQFDLIMGQIK